MSALIFVVLSAIAFRLFWLPGIEFNSKIWDDEITWKNDSQSMSFIDFIFYRDAPGYFVFIPRLITLIGDNTPGVAGFSSLRIWVLLLQLLCFAAAASCVINWSTDWKLWLVLFSTLSVISIEDLNYVHNFGYLLIFPIYNLVFRRFLNNKEIQYRHVILSSFLISKPFTAVTIICLILFISFVKKSKTGPIVLLGAVSLVYLASYFLLPNRWETPFNSDPATIIKIVFDFPWIFFATLLPALFIGLMGMIQVIGSENLQHVSGIALNLSFCTLIYTRRAIILEKIKTISPATKSIVLIFVSNYILVFSNSNSDWVKYFPLYESDSPHHLWLRWSAILPFTSMLIIGSMESISYRFKRNIYFAVSAQWIILAVLASSWLGRYW